MSDFPGKNCWDFPLWLLFFLWQKLVFFRIFRKNVIFFSIKFTVKNRRNVFAIAVKTFQFFFCNDFIAKEFRNFFTSKFIAKKFRKFFTAEFIAKKFSKFFTTEFIENNFEIFYSQLHWKTNSTFFRKIRKKTFLLQNEKWSQWGKSQQFFQENPTLLFVWFWRASAVFARSEINKIREFLIHFWSFTFPVYRNESTHFWILTMFT